MARSFTRAEKARSSALKRHHLVTTVLLLTAASIPACQSRKIDNTMIVDPGEAVSYSQDVRPILNEACGGSGCHIGQSTSGVRMDDYASTMASVGAQYRTEIIQPRNGAESPLVDKLGVSPAFGQRMPFGKMPLSASQVSQIRSWIDDGAEDN